MAPAHVFFTSYARDDNDEQKLASAVKRIEKRVRAMMGVDEDVQIAFFDGNSIETGQQWKERLGDALRETKIIVCMLSPRYVNSAFCAKEFEVFRRRLAAAAQPQKIVVVPVVWEPGSLPEALLEFQFRDDRLPPEYGTTVGLSQITRLRSQVEKLDDVIEVIAEIINKADRDAALPAWVDELDFDELPSFVHSPRREPYRNVTLTVLHDDRAQWRMGGMRTSIGKVADDVAAKAQTSLEVIDPNPANLAQKLAAAQQARHMSIVAIDAEDAQKAPWQALLREIDEARRSNCAVLVALKQPEKLSQIEIQARLAELLPDSTSSGSQHNTFALGDAESCRTAMTRAVAGLQMALIAEDRDRAQQVESPELRAAAADQGIVLNTRPTVSATGGEPQ